MARFSDACVTIVENGPVRATVKVESRYNDSTLIQYFSLTASDKKLTVRARADWHEKHKTLKMVYPMAVENPKAYYEIPFSVIKRPADGEEEPGLGWTVVKGDDAAWAVLNNNTYSSSVKGSTLMQTLLRSCIYGDHGGPRTEESEFTDQGQMDFTYVLMPVGETWHEVTKAAAQLNKPVTVIIESWHEGKLSETFRGISIDCDNVMLSAVKRSEDGCGTVVRLYEIDGHEADVTVSGAILPVEIKDKITPWSVETYYLEDGAAEWKRVLLTEFDA